MTSATPYPSRTRRRRATVLAPGDVVDDETLHPGVVVWLGEPHLDEVERRRYEQVRRAAMRLHPSARPATLRVV